MLAEGAEGKGDEQSAGIDTHQLNNQNGNRHHG